MITSKRLDNGTSALLCTCRRSGWNSTTVQLVLAFHGPTIGFALLVRRSFLDDAVGPENASVPSTHSAYRLESERSSTLARAGP
jgi:hypothetical protein